MTIIFEIDYATKWGENLYICGNTAALGNNRELHAIAMECNDGHTWRAYVELDPESCDKLIYSYLVRRDDGTVRHEWGKGHQLYPGNGDTPIHIYDSWIDTPADKSMHSSAFVECIFKHEAVPVEDRCPTKDSILIQIDAPAIPADMTLAVSGSSDALGRWNHDRVVRLNPYGNGVWGIRIPLSTDEKSFEYKFLVIDSATSGIIAWEPGENRRFSADGAEPETEYVINGLRFNNPLKPWRGAGVVLPVFSLRTEADFGVGDFYDIMPLVDWAVSCGLRFIQVLPVNDTTMTHRWTDSYPYNANSTFALHPMYLRIDEMGTLNSADRRQFYEQKRKGLNALPDMDYEQACSYKRQYTRELFEQDYTEIIESADFKQFVDANRTWLMPYAAFCVLRDRLHTPDIRQWGEYEIYDRQKIERFIDENRHDINYECYLQYHLDRQLRRVRRYADNHGVALKGDIPIGISRDSVDAWLYPELFNLDSSAGAPPDDFSTMGQNWGFPTYNWERMATDGFAWWKARFRKMAEYFNAYRIDHILGFFRIWQIPLNAVHGLLGTFNPAKPFTPDELKYSYDFDFDRLRFTRPYITDDLLDSFDKQIADALRQQYLTAASGGRYELRSSFDTQEKVRDYFYQHHDEENPFSNALRSTLYSLIDDVLFIEDSKEKDKYHPRISPFDTHIYRSLTEHERSAFDRIHEDFFYKRHNDFWREKALWKLPHLIEATDMLVCGEDLGMIPQCVPDVMDSQQILSLKIQRMPDEWGVEFGNTATYPYRSVCATSTHDMAGIREWWEEDHDRSQRFYNLNLQNEGEAPHSAEPYICEQIVEQHLQSPSMLCILPWQDYMAMDGELRLDDYRNERINIPSNPRHYWRYRMHMTIEELTRHTGFSDKIKSMITRSGR